MWTTSWRRWLSWKRWICLLSVCFNSVFHLKFEFNFCFLRECYMNNFVPKCLGCRQIIVDTYIQALGGHYHKDCFVCQVHMNIFLWKTKWKFKECSQPFLTGSFYEHDHQPLCELHYHQRRGSLCSSCQKPIGFVFLLHIFFI